VYRQECEKQYREHEAKVKVVTFILIVTVYFLILEFGRFGHRTSVTSELN